TSGKSRGPTQNDRNGTAHVEAPLSGGADDLEGEELDAALARLPRTDTGNAERLGARHRGQLRFCHDSGKWFCWDDRRYRRDESGAVRRMAKHAVRAMLREAATLTEKDERAALVKWALSSESRARIDAMISLATSEEGVPILHEAMDSDPWLFNCLN